MYGNHKYGTYSKRDINRKHKASRGSWRTSDGEAHKVTVRKIGAVAR